MIYNEVRPKRLSDLVGQEVIKKTLGDALKWGRVAHSMLFIGVRGTGKTSTARVVAKQLNCLSSQDGEPCGCCENCIAIENGSSFDVQELDAAANRGVADMDELLESIYTVPIMKKKVYIIDEVHMLTNEASNRLLKVLEEPPQNVHFILCTTEIMKVLPTIRSRCSMFNFKAIDEVTIATELSKVCDDRNISYQLEALYVVAKAARGSMRDALSLMEPLMEQGVTLEVANDMLGLMDDSVVLSVLSALCKKDVLAVREIIDGMVETGRGVDMILDAMLTTLVDMLAIKLSGNADSVINTQSYVDTLMELSSSLDIEEVIELTEELKTVRKNVGKDANAKLGLLCALMTHIYRQKKNDELAELKAQVGELKALIESGAVVQRTSADVSGSVAQDKATFMSHTEIQTAEPRPAEQAECTVETLKAEQTAKAESSENGSDGYLSMLNSMMSGMVTETANGFVRTTEQTPFDESEEASSPSVSDMSAGMPADMMEVFRNSGLTLEEPVYMTGGSNESKLAPEAGTSNAIVSKEPKTEMPKAEPVTESAVEKEKPEETAGDVVNVGFMSSFLGGSFGNGFSFFK